MGKLRRRSFLDDDSKGFTLIELMVALLISFILIGAVYDTFMNQNKSYIVQGNIVEMQQTLRGVLMRLEQDIRTAGYDPLDSFKYTVTTATDISFGFDADLNDNGGAPATGSGVAERFLYELYGSTTSAGSTVYKIRRTPGGSAIGLNIEDLRFAYAYDSNGNNIVERSVGGNVIWAYPNSTTSTWYSLDTDDNGVIDQLDTPGGSDTGTISNIATIRFVRVWVLVRAAKQDSDYINSTTYIVGSNHFTPPVNDHFRRVVLDITIPCKNMGMTVGI